VPELPEVETTVRDLRQTIVGKRFKGITFQDWEKLFATQPPEVMSQLIRGEQVTALSRRAKYVIVELSNHKSLVFHRKMSGNLFYRHVDDPLDKYTHIILAFDDDSELRFTDLRKFGRVYLFLDEAEKLAHFAKLGPEPLEEEFEFAEFNRIISKRKGMLKPLLLDQSLVVGLGNIYANEALFVSGLHPQRRAETLNDEEKRRLYEAIRVVLEKGIQNRGTSLSDYFDGNGEKGNNQEFLFVHYKKKGAPCDTCGAPIEIIRVGQRSTYLCPTCQPLLRDEG
jgi:formamidopyrimidine-DNA glycosylase